MSALDSLGIAEGQQESVPQSLLMQINADVVCLVRTQFQHLTNLRVALLDRN
jgi:hypothetical protein